MTGETRIDRRLFLAALAGGTSTVVAGCMGDDDSEELPANDSSDGQPTESGPTPPEQLENQAKRDASTVSTWRKWRREWTNGLSTTDSMREDPVEQISTILQENLENIPNGMHAVLYLDLETTEVLASNETAYEGIVLENTEMPWASETSNFESADAVHISAPYRDGDLPVIAFLTPVQEREGVGIAAVARTQAALREDGRTDRFATVLDSQGRIVLDQRGAQFVGQQYGDGPSSEPVEQGTGGAAGFLDTAPIEAELDGEYVAAFAPIDGTDWTVVLHAPAVGEFDVSGTDS